MYIIFDSLQGNRQERYAIFAKAPITGAEIATRGGITI
jgi:hypothetical protein